MHDVVVGLSDATGLSDFFVLAMIFIPAWVVLRMTEKGVSMILGAGFDLTIPLQHYREFLPVRASSVTASLSAAYERATRSCGLTACASLGQ